MKKAKRTLVNYLQDKQVYKTLDSLCARLQADYNGGPEFEQGEEDRLIIYNILEFLDNINEEEKECYKNTIL